MLTHENVPPCQGVTEGSDRETFVSVWVVKEVAGLCSCTYAP